MRDIVQRMQAAGDNTGDSGSFLRDSGVDYEGGRLKQACRDLQRVDHEAVFAGPAAR